MTDAKQMSDMVAYDSEGSDVDSVTSVGSEEEFDNSGCIEWKDLSFSVRSENMIQRMCRRGAECFGKQEVDLEAQIETGETDEKIILHKSSGKVTRGSLVALMGSSGAGKSSFLNVLAHQLESTKGSHVRGEVKIFGKPSTKEMFKKYCGYVWQEDLLMPYLTVEQTITFYAHLRLSPYMSFADKKARVDETITKLGLNHVRDTIIGDQTRRGISGGEKRRVSIGVELIKNPSVLFLDEPTSGLDARTSLTIMNTLSTLAHQYNHTIICTIHQPRSEIFSLFDDLILLAQGHLVYHGPISNTVLYFKQLGHPCPNLVNPADFVIDLLTIDSTSQEDTTQSQERIDYFVEIAGQNSPYNGIGRGRGERSYSTALKLEDGSSSGGSESRAMLKKCKTMEAVVREEDIESSGHAGVIRSTLLLTIRLFWGMWKNKSMVLTRVIQSLVMIVFIGLLFFQLDDDQDSVYDRRSFLFLALMSATFPESLASISIFANDRAIFQRERRAKMYGVLPYYIAKQIAEFPMQLLIPLIFSSIIYWPVGMQYDFIKWVEFTAIVVSVTLTISALGMFVGALLPLNIAAVISPVINVFMFLFGGFFIRPDDMPVYFRYFRFLSPFYYALMALINNQFSDLDLHCEDDQLKRNTFSYVCNGIETTVVEELCPYTSGDQVVDDEDADLIPIWGNLVILFTMVIVLRLALYFALRFVKPKSA